MPPHVLTLALVLMVPAMALAQDPAAAGLEIEQVPEVQLVIIGPSTQEYTLYGHATLLVIDDPDAPIAEARGYNFGVTNFKRPNYVADFIGGRVMFWGESAPYAKMLARWKKRDRSVTRYPVLLDDGARRRVVARLKRDVSETHKHYLYDTFRENCATRLRDYLDTYSGGAIFAATGDQLTTRTFRDDARHAYSNVTSIMLMSELVPGVDLDRPRTVWQLMYRPEYLGEQLTRVQLAGGPLLGPPIVDHVRTGTDPRDGMRQHGQYFYLLISALLALLGWWIGGRGPRTRAGVLAGTALLTTVIGTTLIWVALHTDWPEMQRNPSVFVFVPLDIALLWTAGRLFIGGGSGDATIARAWLRGRLIVALLLVALTPVFDLVRGPIPPRLMAVVLVWVMLRCLDRPGPARV